MTKEKIMSFEKFKTIIEILQEFQKKRDRIGDFFEKELCEDSFCIITLGNKVEDVVINLLADEFKCWYSFRNSLRVKFDNEKGTFVSEGTSEKEEEKYEWWVNRTAIENDIENFLYKMEDESQSITVGNKVFLIETVEDLYNYLVYNYSRNLTES